MAPGTGAGAGQLRGGHAAAQPGLSRGLDDMRNIREIRTVILRGRLVAP